MLEVFAQDLAVFLGIDGDELAADVLFFLALELHGTLPRLVLLRFLLRLGLKAFLDDAEVFEVGEFHCLIVQAAEVLFFLFAAVVNGAFDIIQEGLGAMEYVHKTGSKVLVCEELVNWSIV